MRLVLGAGVASGAPDDALVRLLPAALAAALPDSAELGAGPDAVPDNGELPDNGEGGGGPDAVPAPAALDVAQVRAPERLAGHPAVRALAVAVGAPVVAVAPDEVARQHTPTRSARSLAATGAGSAAEAAALSGGGELLAPRATGDRATLAVARAVDLDHHGDAEARAEGVRLDLAVNVAVDAMPGFVRDAVAATLDRLAAYPDTAPTTAAVAAHLGVDPACVLLVNGAAQAFTLVAAAREWGSAVVVHPQFTEPEAALRAARVPVARHVLPAPFRLDPAALHADHPGADLVVVGNPTNPTSVLHPRADVLAARPHAGVLLVDEAFVDTCTDPAQSVLADAARPGSGVLVVRSLTKTFGLAGLRAGYVVGDPALVADLARVQPAWSVSTPALAAVAACGTPTGDAFADAQRRRLTASAAHLAARLTSLGLDVVAPQGPFVLADGPAVPGLRAALRADGIATRTCATFPGLDDTWVRLAARDPDVVDPVIDAARRHLAGSRTAPVASAQPEGGAPAVVPARTESADLAGPGARPTDPTTHPRQEQP